MKLRSPVLIKLAEMYEESAAGRHGGGKLDFQPLIEDLLTEAGCGEGEARELAEADLRAARDAGVIQLVPIHRRAPDHFGKLRLAPDKEASFFAWIGLASPTQKRAQWAALFDEAAEWQVPERLMEAWQSFCHRRAQAAMNWRDMKPFDRKDIAGGRELLALLPRLLAWEGRNLVRWVSSVICEQSKFLERRQKTLELLLADASANLAPTFESLGILPVPPGVMFHGPLRLRIGSEWRDFRDLHGPATLSGADVERVSACECEARRCLTVENVTPFRSLAALHSGELLIHTSYANKATLDLIEHLRALSSPPEFWHFGDTDPSGFHILADLRERSGIPFRSFHMSFRTSKSPNANRLTERERCLVGELISKMPAERAALERILSEQNKGAFEQEGLNPPKYRSWPYYDGVQ